jgi:hypothetical protein
MGPEPEETSGARTHGRSVFSALLRLRLPRRGAKPTPATACGKARLSATRAPPLTPDGRARGSSPSPSFRGLPRRERRVRSRASSLSSLPFRLCIQRKKRGAHFVDGAGKEIRLLLGVSGRRDGDPGREARRDARGERREAPTPHRGRSRTRGDRGESGVPEDARAPDRRPRAGLGTRPRRPERTPSSEVPTPRPRRKRLRNAARVPPGRSSTRGGPRRCRRARGRGGSRGVGAPRARSRPRAEEAAAPSPSEARCEPRPRPRNSRSGAGTQGRADG